VLIRWAGVGAACVAATVALSAAGLPSAALFAALLVGVSYALAWGRWPLRLPSGGIVVGQAVIGVALGLQIEASTLRVVGSSWFGVLVVTAGTLFLSLGVGLLLAHRRGLAPATGALGMVAGGASGIVAMADELGADARLVAFMQYMRVIVVVVVGPLTAYALLHHGSHTPTPTPQHDSRLAVDLAFTVGCAVLGAMLARAFRITAGSLLGPLLLASVLSISGLAEGIRVPDLVQNVGFALIGLQVGLRFTVATIHAAGRLLAPVLLSILVLIVGCAALAALLVPLAHVSYADAYLATTPGGLYAVLAASIGIGANTTFVVSVQVARLFVIILAAPTLVRLITRNTPRATAIAATAVQNDQT
jgi:membrane AbrB-like protein